MFSGFIFDVEGTLVDSVPQNLRSLQDALERSGYRIPYQTLQLYSGLDGDQTLQLAIPEASEEERRDILKVQGEIYERQREAVRRHPRCVSYSDRERRTRCARNRLQGAPFQALHVSTK